MISGSIQEKNGNLYAVLSVPTQGGKHDKIWRTMHMKATASERQQNRRLDEIRLQYSNVASLEAVETLFCDYIVKWNNETADEKQETTVNGYNHMIEKYLYPYFKEKKITVQDLRPMDIEAYYKYLQRDCGLSGNTALKHHQIIYTALKYAVYNRMLKNNPAENVRRPKKGRAEHDFYNADELRELMQAVKGHTLETAVYMAIWFGLRRSEILGLEWKNIDFDNHTIAICEKVTRVKREGKWVDVSSNKMKTETSNRVIQMSDEVEKYLWHVKQEQMKYKLLCGDCYTSNDFVCVNKMGERIKSDYITRAFNKLLEKNGLRHIKFHDLRHSCASYMQSKGFSLKDIQELLGHSDYNFTVNPANRHTPKADKFDNTKSRLN
jgi:integrase